MGLVLQVQVISHLLNLFILVLAFALHARSSGPPPLLPPRQLAILPSEPSLTTLPVIPTPYDAAAPIPGTPYSYTPPPVAESALAPSALVLSPPVADSALAPSALVLSPPVADGADSAQAPSALVLSPPVADSAHAPSAMVVSPPVADSAQAPSALVLSPPVVEPPHTFDVPPVAKSPQEALPVLPTPTPYGSPKDGPVKPLSPVTLPVLSPPSQMAVEPPVEAPPFRPGLPDESPQHAPGIQLSPTPLPILSPPSQMGPSQVSSQTTAPLPLVLPFPLVPRQTSSSPSPSAVNEPILREPPPPAHNAPLLQSSPPPAVPPSQQPRAETPRTPSLPLPAIPPLLPVSESPEALPSLPPASAMPSTALSPPQPVPPIAPSDSSIQPPSMFQNASSPPPLPSPLIVASPPPEIISPITSSPPPQSSLVNASSLVPPRSSPSIPVLPPNPSFSPPFMASSPMGSPPNLPTPPTSTPPPLIGPLPASSPPPQSPPIDASSPAPPLISPPSSSFSPPLMGSPIGAPPNISTELPPVPQNASSLSPQMGPPLISSPPPQLVVPPPASPPTSVLPRIPSISPPPMAPPPVPSSVAPAMPPRNITTLSPPSSSQAVSPLPHFAPPHSLSPPLANPPQMFSSPPPAVTSPPISSVDPRVISPRASSPPLVLSPPLPSPPRGKDSHALFAPPPSESSYPLSPPPAVNRIAPALPPHSSQREVTKAGAHTPPPLPTTSDASPPSGITYSRAAPPMEQVKPVSSPPKRQPVEAPHHRVPSSRSTALAPSVPKIEWHNETAPAPLFFHVNASANGSYHTRHHSSMAGAPMVMGPLPSPRGIHENSSTASPVPHAPSINSEIPFLSPDISPSGSSPRKIKKPIPSPIRSLPPPPPNADCGYLTCPEPSTNTPPGSPCGCVWPMQVGMRLSVALYTFFPLVSELSQEIASGVFLKPGQVRVMGANAATQEPEKTIVLVDLVPLDEKFDNITSHLISDRFWHKQVVIDKSIFGDYDILYVRYPGLPPSPPMAPADAAVINGMPYSVGDPNENKLHPLGVDVTKQRHKHKLNAVIIAVIALAAVLGVLMCCSLAWFMVSRHTNNKEVLTITPRAVTSLGRSSGLTGRSIGSGQSSPPLSLGSSLATYNGSAKTFSTSEMEKATDNFNPSRILGEGGFGLVFRGDLDDDTRIAVKVLKRDDQQGGREFLAEVEMLSRLHHRNLVKLIGICTDDPMRCLVYELIPNGSVDSHLHGDDKDIAPLDWPSRLKIALGAARGLAYLHEDSSPRVIHRDFKSSNILLENDFTPKVSDFGLARTAMDEEHQHISTRVMGTFGYVAPEYAMTGHLLVKSDVYSYGVVLLELLTGRKPVDMSQPAGEENLVAWTRPLLTTREGLESIIDASLGSQVPFESVAKVAAIASMCVQREVSHRPFMGEVVQALKLVCNECDDSSSSKDGGSRNHSHEDLSLDCDDAKLSSPLSGQFSHPNYAPRHDVEKGLSVSEMFSASGNLGRQASDSFRRHSSSGPLITARGRQFWQRIRRQSRGSVSERRTMYSLWTASH